MLRRVALGTMLVVIHGAAAFNSAQIAIPGRYTLRSAAMMPLSSPAGGRSLVGARVLTRGAAALSNVRMSSTAGEVDAKRVATYFGATGVEVLFISAAMWVIQTVGAMLPPVGYQVLACVFFAAMSLKSRVFAILDARRPELGSDLGNKIMVETKRPSWTPPGVVFPIVWSTIGVLRTVSSLLVWEACGRQMLVVPLVAMMTHLAIGDTWNSINNVEQRKGTAVAGVAFVWMSVMTCIYLYYKTLPLAGIVLAPSGLWLTVASVLIYSIWRLNGSDPILPRKPLPSAD